MSGFTGFYWCFFILLQHDKKKAIKGSVLAYISENEQLKRKLKRYVVLTKENQSVLERFQQFEMNLLGAKDLTELLETLLLKSIRHFDLSDCRLVWFDQKMPLCSFVDDEIKEQFSHRLVFSEFQQEIEALFSDTLAPALCALTPEQKNHWFPSGTKVLSAAFIPLVCQGSLQGALLFGSPVLERFSHEKATDFIARMGLILAVCLQNNIHREQIRLLSMLDNLTKVKNRRCFDQDIKGEVARSRRNNTPLSCLFVDADLFKNVNDTYGHPGGDETLICMSRWIQEQLRDCDHLARLGGEEFVVLLPQCDDELAAVVAERVRAYVESQRIHFQQFEFSITLSIGVSTFYPERFPHMLPEDVAEKLVAHADLGVYDAKEGGRNRVSVREFVDIVESMAQA